MRFLAQGPSIPDEVLIARDEGRAVFFCGAGVSRARAGLPDFFGLAKCVSEILGVAPDSPASRIIGEAREIEKKFGEAGLISADRVFGLLERQFTDRDIHAAVAKALTPAANVDLSAHRVLLDLAWGPDGKTRLVTTNFDRLFESCDNTVPCWHPPRLPNPLRHDEMDGIVHLHGRVNVRYDGAEGDGLVLSSSEFGRAYLSDAWATAFIQSILEKYLVVFVGYTADDPPVLYLLEALNRSLVPRAALYAFQAGDQSDAQSKWVHKGVKPIAYNEDESHSILWDTLTAWSSRARDIEGWHQGVISLARRGPDTLLPHERGQVAHVVSTQEGAPRFSSADPPPPAEWLCVFDASVRYSTPRHEYNLTESRTFIDPFALYGLDSDVVPEKIDPEDHYKKRELPNEAWDCFKLTRLDRQDLSDQNLPALRGYLSTHVPRLPVRLWQLGLWLRKVSAQPAAVWWAAGQNGIHREFQKQVRFELGHGSNSTPVEIRKAWRYIFESWNAKRDTFDSDWFDFKTSIARDGWTSSAVRELASILRPYLTAGRPFGAPRPPAGSDHVRRRNLVELDVKYPEPHDKIEVPGEHLLLAVRELRGNLELAVLLERELDGHGLTNLAPIEPDPDLEGEPTGRSFGIAVPFLLFVDHFRKLVERDVSAATQEFSTWWTDDDTVFARLRIWTSGDVRLLSGPEAGDVLLGLADPVFWASRHQRDLLLVIARRWDDFTPELRTALGDRLLKGPSKWDEEEDERFAERCAWSSLDRIHWLNGRGCTFDFDVRAQIARLRALAPRWQEEYGQKAASSLEGVAGWGKTDKGFDSLLSVPRSDVLRRAVEISGRQPGKFVDNDPYSGLALGRPVHALTALTLAGRRGDYPEWAWRTFLNPVARKSDKPRLSALIAERIARLPHNVLAPLTNSVSEWLLSVSGILLTKYPIQFGRLWDALLRVLRSSKEQGRSSVIRRGGEAEWATEALNSPVGKLAQALMDDPQKDNLRAGAGFPSAWEGRVDELLSLEGDLRRHALVMFSYNLAWFYAIDGAWTKRQLLSAIDDGREDQAAVWAGVFWHAQVPGGQLYSFLKPYLLELAKSRSISRRGHVRVLSGFILAGWGANAETGHGDVADSEARDVLLNSDEDFRLNVLWQLGQWSVEEHWARQVPRFLKDVWPRQKKVRTPRASVRLCELALSNPTNFPELADAVLPLVIRADGEHIFLHGLSPDNGTVKDHPERVLALLHAILPDDTSLWPHRMHEVLGTIEGADTSLTRDARLVELKRRWNAR